jgi:hypothetical protein
MRTAKTGSILCLLLLAGACRADGIGTRGPSWFRASVEGEVSRQFEGSGDFDSAPDRDGANAPRYFMLFSRGSDPALGETFYLRWPVAGRPAPGRYALVPHTDQYGSATGVTGIYLWQQGDNVSAPSRSELYVAVAGVVEITRSDDDQIEGTVRFSGLQVEKWGPVHPERSNPRHQPDPTAPRIDVTGTFRATKFDIGRWTVATS